MSERSEYAHQQVADFIRQAAETCNDHGDIDQSAEFLKLLPAEAPAPAQPAEEALINALEKLIEVTYTAAIEGGDPGIQNARIHGRAAIALARKGAA